MQMQNKVELIKKLDEHECLLSCTSTAPISFLLDCLEHFKAYLLQIKAAKEKEAADQKQLEEQEVKNVSQ